ncbi:MAG: hypothetical protein ACYC54_07750 [Sedimentisphaerales bacterium]
MKKTSLKSRFPNVFFVDLKPKITPKQHLCWRFRRFLGQKNTYVNPIQGSCVSAYAFDALYELGKNEWHQIDKVAEKTIELMSSIKHSSGITVWETFLVRITSNNSDPRLRLINLLSKLSNKFGDRLAEMGCRLEIEKRKDGKYLRLNTVTQNKVLDSADVKTDGRRSFWRIFLPFIRFFNF